jgi:hypothetical protein
VSSSSDEINPVPKVIVSSQESIKIVDLDSGESETIPKSMGIPIDFAVSIEENIVYWVNNLEEIFSSRINGSGHYKVTIFYLLNWARGHRFHVQCLYWFRVGTPNQYKHFVLVPNVFYV